MVCPNCESNNTLRLAGEYNSCVQCGYEDYTSIARPKYKSNGLHYKARYDGDVESQGSVTVDVYLKKRERETSTKPMITPHCPFDQRTMVLQRTGDVAKYKCYSGHIVYLRTDKEGNFLWN